MERTRHHAPKYAFGFMDEDDPFFVLLMSQSPLHFPFLDRKVPKREAL